MVWLPFVQPASYVKLFDTLVRRWDGEKAVNYRI